MFDLCLALGRWDVDGVAEEMPQRLFYEWQAYARLNPFGQARGDLQAAYAAKAAFDGAKMITASLAHKRRYTPSSLSDFMPEFRPKKPKTDWELWHELKTGLELGYGLKRIEKPS